MLNQEQASYMRAVGNVFLLSFIFAMLLMLFWMGMIFFLGEWAFGILSQWFELDRRAFDLMNYYGMAFVKTISILFFLIPYLAIRIVVKNK